MTTLLEDPTWIIVLGIVVEAVLAVLLVNLRQGWIAWAMVGVLILVLAGVGLEWLIVTEKERVEATIYAAAESLEANDLDRLLNEHIAPAPRGALARQLATDALTRFEITAPAALKSPVTISNLKVMINDLTSPPTAEVEFRASVHFKDRKGRIPHRHYPADCTVVLHLEGDRWLVVDPVRYTDVR